MGRVTEYVDVRIDEAMLSSAQSTVATVRVHRTQASPYDTLVGILGEFAFAQWWRGSWEMHEVGDNRGDIDFSDGVEVKTSAFPFSDRLNLLVRSDYAKARAPDAYVQVILCIPRRDSRSIAPGTIARLSGWASHRELVDAPQRDFGSKFGGRGGYMCHFIPIHSLHPMATLRTWMHPNRAAED